MDKKFDFTTMELLLQKLEKDDNPELKALVNDLILLSRKAGQPELESLLQYLLSRVSTTDEFLN